MASTKRWESKTEFSGRSNEDLYRELLERQLSNELVKTEVLELERSKLHEERRVLELQQQYYLQQVYGACNIAFQSTDRGNRSTPSAPSVLANLSPLPPIETFGSRPLSRLPEVCEDEDEKDWAL